MAARSDCQSSAFWKSELAKQAHPLQHTSKTAVDMNEDNAFSDYLDSIKEHRSKGECRVLRARWAGSRSDNLLQPSRNNSFTSQNNVIEWGVINSHVINHAAKTAFSLHYNAIWAKDYRRHSRELSLSRKLKRQKSADAKPFQSYTAFLRNAVNPDWELAQS